MIRTYSELIKLPTFKERYEYLKLTGVVGAQTFGSDRYLGQFFYRSSEWKSLRDFVIIRDNGCDLAVEGYDLYDHITIHHMNPISVDDIMKHSAFLLDPEFLICVSHRTHNAIHYGDEALLTPTPNGRFQNDTCPWRK